MGRHLANGVMTRFEIAKKNSWYSDKGFNLEQEIDNVLKDISDIIEPSMYKLVKKEEDCYSFALKEAIFNKNIHELIREIIPLTYPNVLYLHNILSELKEKNIDIDSNEFIENYPFEAKINDNGAYFIEMNGKVLEENNLFYPLDWLIKEKRLFKNVEIYASVTVLWIDEDKYDGEDETNMLRVINNMKVKYYNTPLSKAFIYYVLG